MPNMPFSIFHAGIGCMPRPTVSRGDAVAEVARAQGWQI
jgi:hypothetical protein